MVGGVNAREELWSVEQLAAYLKVPVATVYSWRSKGYGPVGIRVGRYVRYRASDVEAWLASQQQGGESG